MVLLDELPKEMLPTLAGYLPSLDTLQLSGTSKNIYLNLSANATLPRQILSSFIRKDCDDDIHYGFDIPITHQVSIHSVLVSMSWRDQGWGNRKSKVVIVAKDNTSLQGLEENRNVMSNERFGGGRVVYHSAIASHEEQRLDITLFAPKEGVTYQLWYSVGGGGGHSIHLVNVRTQTLVFDDPFRSFGKAHSFLVTSGAVPAWDKNIGTAGDLQQLLAMHQPEKDISEADLQNMLELIQSMWASWMEERSAYEQIKSNHQPQWENRYFDMNMQNDDFIEDRMDFGEYVVQHGGDF